MQCSARLPIHTLNYWTVLSVVFGFYLGVCLSVTLLIVDLRQYCVCYICMLYNPMHPLNGALPGSYVPVRGTCSALVVDRYTHEPPSCRTSQYCRTLVLLSVSLWNSLAEPIFHGVGLASFKSRTNAFLLA